MHTNVSKVSSSGHMIDRLNIYQNGDRMRAHLVCGTAILLEKNNSYYEN
jgi:hypothetical protein